MKKFFALTLAVAMVLSLASVAMAAVTVGYDKNTSGAERIVKSFYTFDKDAAAGSKWDTVATGGEVTFGKTLYLPLVNNRTNELSSAEADINKTDRNIFVTDADAVKGLKVDAKWEQNGEYVKGVEIVKVDKLYAIAFTTTGSSLSEVEVLGEITLKGKTYWTVDDGTDVDTEKGSVESKFDVQIDLKWPTDDAADNMKVGTKTVYDFEDVDEDDAEDFVINFGDDVEVETNVKNMKKVLLGCSTKENEDILDEYVDADLEFYTLTGTFRRTATVTIDAEEGSYLYENVDGKLVEVDAEYDEWDEAFTFKTKKLGAYVVSNMKLDTTAAVETAPANPSTGAAA